MIFSCFNYFNVYVLERESPGEKFSLRWWQISFFKMFIFCCWNIQLLESAIKFLKVKKTAAPSHDQKTFSFKLNFAKCIEKKKNSKMLVFILIHLACKQVLSNIWAFCESQSHFISEHDLIDHILNELECQSFQKLNCRKSLNQ